MMSSSEVLLGLEVAEPEPAPEPAPAPVSEPEPAPEPEPARDAPTEPIEAAAPPPAPIAPLVAVTALPPPVEDIGGPPCKLFVGGLSWSTSAEHLRQHFGQYGPVEDSMIMKVLACETSRCARAVFTRATPATPHRNARPAGRAASDSS